MAKNHSVEGSLRSAAVWNGGMAAVQLVVAVATGNVGYFNEAGHNTADSISYEAKSRAAVHENASKSLRLRKVACAVMALGAGYSFYGGVSNILEHEKEQTSPALIALALGGAIVNAGISKRVHGAGGEHENESGHGHAHDHSHGAHQDGKLHTVADAVTGMLYSTGLAAETTHPGAANYVILLNGFITGGHALAIANNINKAE